MCAPITLDDIDQFPPRIQDEVRAMLVFTLRLQTAVYSLMLLVFWMMLLHTWFIQ